MWGYDSCFFWVTIEVSLQCTTNSSRARKTYSVSNEKSDLGDIDFDLRCLECSLGRFTFISRDPANWRELERIRFSRLQQCWTLLEWMLLDHIRSTIKVYYCTCRFCSPPRKHVHCQLQPRWSTSSWVFVGTCTPAATPAAMSCWIFHKMMLARLIWSSKISRSTGREGDQFRII